jgi:hypothetical protein
MAFPSACCLLRGCVGACVRACVATIVAGPRRHLECRQGALAPNAWACSYQSGWMLVSASASANLHIDGVTCCYLSGGGGGGLQVRLQGASICRCYHCSFFSTRRTSAP